MRRVAIEDEYDEPWEWSVRARLTSSLQVSPAPSLDEERLASDLEDEDAMTARQQRRLLYETAFDSRVKRDADDLDGLMQSSPLFHNRTPANESVARAASRSSFGSTSGSSASSTPTHQPMEIARQSPRHFTPTERRKVTLVRDGLPRSMSPQARPSGGLRNIVNMNFERKISFSSNHWDSISRCSGSDKSSSQESMNLDLSGSRNERSSVMLGRSASRDSLNVFREDRSRCNQKSNYPNSWKELTSAKRENATDFQKCVLLADEKQDDVATKKSAIGQIGVKVLPCDDGSSHITQTISSKASDPVSQPYAQDPELKENDSQLLPAGAHYPVRKPISRPSSLLSEVRPMDNLPQSPENDCRSSEDYDPPWDLKINKRPSSVNSSVSVPERLSSSGGQPQLPTSITHDKLLDVVEEKDRPLAALKQNKPKGPSSRANLNLSLNSDSPRKARQNLTLNFGCAALSAVGEKVDPQLTLEKQGWYHGSISRVDAEAKLRVLKEGSYLVRNSESSKRDYSLSLRSARGFMHMKIVPTSEGRFILGQFSNPFSSIPEMIQHYTINKLPIKGAEHMSLLYPVIDQLL